MYGSLDRWGMPEDCSTKFLQGTWWLETVHVMSVEDATRMVLFMSACGQLGFLSVAKQMHGLLQMGLFGMNCMCRILWLTYLPSVVALVKLISFFVEVHWKDVVSCDVMVSALARCSEAF